MIEYPIAVAGVFTRQDSSEPFCSICFLGTAPPVASINEVEALIYSEVFPALAQIIVNSPAEIVSDAIDTCAIQLSVEFDMDCVGYLNEAFVNGVSQDQKGET